jgi:hypothetical protein
MKEIVGSGLEGEPSASSGASHRRREVAAIPILASGVVEAEVLDLFVDGRTDVGMHGQILVEGGRPSPLCPDDEKVGQQPQRTGGRTDDDPRGDERPS